MARKITVYPARVSSPNTIVLVTWCGVTLILALLLLLSITELWKSAISAVLLAFAQVAVAGSILAVRYRRYGLGDPLSLFTVVFLVYNAGVLLQFAGDFAETGYRFVYVRSYSLNEIIRTGIASLLALLGLWVAAVLLSLLKEHRELQFPPVIRITKSVRRMFVLGLVTTIVYFLLYYGTVAMKVGITEFLGAARTGSARINPSTALGIGIPLSPLVVAGFAAMFWGYAIVPTSGRRWLMSIVVAIFVLLNFVQGSRHLVIYLFLMAVGTYVTFMSIRVISIRKLLFGGAASYIVFIVVSETRSTLIAYFAGHVALGEWTAKILQFSWKWLLPGGNEFGAVYVTLLETVNIPSPLLLGRTYLEAIFYILPTRLYPGVKPPDLGAEFAILLGRQFEWLTGVGFGFSPVAEAYLNVGLLGIPFVFALFAFILHWVGLLRRKGMTGNLIYIVLLGQMINANRYSLDGVLQEAAFSVAIVLMLCVLARSR